MSARLLLLSAPLALALGSALGGDAPPPATPRGAAGSPAPSRAVWLAGVSRRVWVPAREAARETGAGTRHQVRAGRYVWIHEPGRFEQEAPQPARESAAGP